MGGIINLADFRSRKDARERLRAVPRGTTRVEFFFDLASPFTYLAAERVERSFADVLWTPAAGSALRRGDPEGPSDRARATERAAALRLPLVWPERWPREVPAAMRAASCAAAQGRGAAFVLAACRLAWAGGFDLEDPDVIAEAAAAASVRLDEGADVLADAAADEVIAEAGRRIHALGADRLPALVVGAAVFAGEERVAEAAAYARHRAAEGA